MTPALPVAGNTFIGREHTLADLAELFFHGTRLITLTGPPGMGKTRVALRYASSVDGAVHVCDLTQARTHDDVVGMVALALGIPTSMAVEDAAAHVGHALLSLGPRLLVLDNFEQLTHCAASTVGAWCAAAPDMSFLVTSRERLQLPTEHVVTLPPLELPNSREVDAAASVASVRLFVDRAQQAGAGFKLTSRNTPDVVELVRRLEGIPLAIELAAARMAVMTPAQANAHLAEGMDVLEAAPRGGNARHRTLRSAVHWSWTLLNPQEQDALARCSVFKGTFTLDALAAVLGPGTRAVDVVQALVDKSLVVRVPSEKTQRFRLYTPVAEFAAEQLGDAAPDVATRFLQWMVARGQTLAAGLDTPQDADCVEELVLEQDNLIHLVRDACARGDAAGAFQCVLVLDPLLSRRGPLDVHVALLDEALALVDRCVVEPSWVAQALEARGRVRQQRGRLEECMEDLTRAAETAAAVGEHRTSARALAEMAALHRRRGNSVQAQALFARAMATFVDLKDERLQGRIHGELGILHKEQGDLAEARIQYDLALQQLREAGDRRHEGRVILDLGALHQEEGRMAEARVCFEAALRIHQAGGNKRFEALARCDLGCLALEEGRHGQALEHLGAAVSLLRDMGDRRTGSRFEGILAAAMARQGLVDQATQAFDRAEAELARVGDLLGLCAVRVHRGQLDLAHHAQALADGRADEAAQHLHLARQRLLHGTQQGPGGAPSPSERSDDVRLAMRLVRASLLAVAPDAPCLKVGPMGTWFLTPQGERVDLANRRTPARLLKLLADQRVGHPGVALTPEELVAGGWPGERMGAQAAINRLHVTLATLRRLGLKGLLQRVEQGYLLDPAVPLTLE